MKTYSLKNRPDPNNMTVMLKKGTIAVKFIKEPFIVETEEGALEISPETTDNWEDGYYIAYPWDGRKPYAISPSFIKANYVEA